VEALEAGATSRACQSRGCLDALAFMTVFDRLERRFGWMAFPGFLRYYALFQVLVFVLQFIRPDIGPLLDFDRAKIADGEYWRVVSGFFATGFGRPSLMSIVFLACMVSFIFMISDGLEAAWGVFKTSIFYYMGITTLLALNFFYPVELPMSGIFLYLSAFLAFATLFPKVEIRLFLILPVRMQILGIIEAVSLVLMMVNEPVVAPFILISFANYIIWAGIPALRGTARVLESVQRRKSFNAAKMSDAEAFHTCTVCARTDVTDPQLEFRIGNDGLEYCSEHLPKSD
jgi:hypothetical protein